MDTWKRPPARGCAWILHLQTGKAWPVKAEGATKREADEVAFRIATNHQVLGRTNQTPALYVALTSAAANAAGIVAAFYAPLEKTAG